MKLSKARSYQHASTWMGAILVGGAAVLYARLVSVSQGLFFTTFAKHPYYTSAVAPFIFLLAVFFVRKFAPDAKGSGIPQVLEAIETAKTPGLDEIAWASPLVSLRTAFIKVVSSALGVLGGASIGREGPTVQIASSVFAWVGRTVKKRVTCYP